MKAIYHLIIGTLWLVAGLAVAQNTAPTSPSFPISADQCKDYSIRMDRYLSNLNEEHSSCLRRYDAAASIGKEKDRCSRVQCQLLHDLVFGPSAERNRASVAKCYEDLRSYLEEKAKKESARKKEDEDYQQRERARGNEERARENRHPTQPSQINSGTQPRGQVAHTPVTANSAGNDSAKANPTTVHQSQEGRSELKDPFERAQQEAITLGISKSKLYDPFSGPQVTGTNDAHGAEIVDPFSKQSKKAGSTEQDGVSEEVGEAIGEGIQEGFDMLKAAVEEGKDQAKQKLSSAAYKRYVESANDAISISSGVVHTITFLQDVALVKNVYEADVPEARKREEARLGYQVGKDTVSYTFSRDAVKQGVQNVIVRTFPEKVAPYVVEFGSVAFTAASIIFDSSEAAAPGLLHNEPWNTMSSKQKEQVLASGWKDYDNAYRAGHADDFPVDDLRTLIDQTDALYKANLLKQ